MRHGFRRTTLLAAIVAGALLIAGVAGCAPVVPGEPAGITGSITYIALTATPPPLASITVEGGVQPDGAVSDKAVVAVTDKTNLFDAEGQKAELQSLRVGQQVKVWFTGPVAESYPVQGTASAIQVIGAGQ